MRRSLVMLLVAAQVVAAVIVLGAAPGAACSCSGPDPGRTLRTATAVFVGTAVEMVEGPSIAEDSWPRAVVRFEVESVLKGDVADDAVLFVKAGSDSCGEPHFLPGEPGSLFGKPATIRVFSPSEPMVAEACTDLSPQSLTGEPIEPLPPPIGVGQAHMVELDERSGTSVRLLDAEGHAIAYVESRGVIADGAVCSDGSSIVQVVLHDGVPTMEWRDIATLNVTARQALDDQSRVWGVMACAAGDRVMAWAGRQQILVVDPTGPVLAIQSDGGGWHGLSPDGSIITVDRGDEIGIYSIEDRRETAVISDLAPGDIYGVAVSPDARKVAVITYDDGPHLTIATVDGQIIDTIDPPGTNAGSGLWWLDDDTVAVNTDGVEILGIGESTPDYVGVASPVGDTRVFAGSRVVLAPQDDGSEVGPYEVVDLSTGQRTASATFTRFQRAPLALPEPVEFTGVSYTPELEPTWLPGAALPGSVEELEATAGAPQARTPWEPPVPPTPTPVPLSPPIGSPDEPAEGVNAPTEDTEASGQLFVDDLSEGRPSSGDLIGAGAAVIAAAAVGAYGVRRRRRQLQAAEQSIL